MWCGFADQTQTPIHTLRTEPSTRITTTMNQALKETCATFGITLEEGFLRKRIALDKITENRKGITEGERPPQEIGLTKRDYLFFLVYRFHLSKTPTKNQWETLSRVNEADCPWGKLAHVAIFQLLETKKPTGSYQNLQANRQPLPLPDVMPKHDTETSMPAAT